MPTKDIVTSTTYSIFVSFFCIISVVIAAQAPGSLPVTMSDMTHANRLRELCTAADLASLEIRPAPSNSAARWCSDREQTDPYPSNTRTRPQRRRHAKITNSRTTHSNRNTALTPLTENKSTTSGLLVSKI